MSPNGQGTTSRLAASYYQSPYCRNGAPRQAGEDPYVVLRAKALTTLEAMGYDPDTMTEQGVRWAEDQDPFGHVKQLAINGWLTSPMYRFMESHEQYLSPQEHADMMGAKTVILVSRKYEQNIYRSVEYPDSLIAAWRIESVGPDRLYGTVCLFSLKQQAIVATKVGQAVYMDVRTRRTANLRKLGGNWLALYQSFEEKSRKTNELLAKWNAEHGKSEGKQSRSSKI